MVGSLFLGLRRFLTPILVICAGILLLAPNTSLAAFGASPPFLNASHLVKGASYEQTIYLVRDNTDTALPILAELDLPENIRSWVSMEQGTSFVIPEGTRQFPVKILINVPQSAELGVYSGSITFGSQPEQTGQVTVSLGIEIPINLTVGTNIYREIKTRLVKLLDIEEGWNPRVYIKLQNAGNIPEKFDSATYELFDAFKDKRFAISQKREGFPEIKPFTTEEFTVEFPVDFHLGVGQYWGSVTFYQGDKAVGGQTTIFSVLKKGSLSNPADQALAFMRLNEFWPYYSIVLIILIGTIIFWRKKRSRNGKISE